jgi:hypothetical protein
VNVAELLDDAFGRIAEIVHEAIDDLTPDQLARRIDPEANSIAWLVWHLTRVQDDHVAGVAGLPQVWTAGGWEERFGLPLPTSSLGSSPTTTPPTNRPSSTSKGSSTATSTASWTNAGTRR